MKFIKASIFFIVSLAVSPVLSQSISCVYSTTTVDNIERYVCNLAIDNPNGVDNFDTIPGDHLEGQTDADVTYVTSYQGSTTIVPQILCSQFPNIQFINFVSFGLTTLTATSFGGCPRLLSIDLFSNQINSVAADTFVNNRNATFINLGQNRLESLSEGVFANQQLLDTLELNSNPFSSNFPAGIFSQLTNLRLLLLNNCRQTQINPNWFTGLSNLYLLNMQNNMILELPENAFSGLENLSILNLNQNYIQMVDRNAFATLRSLKYIFMEENQIDELPSEVFAPFEAVTYVDLRLNRLKTLNRDQFGPLEALGTLDLDFNVINALDQRIFNEAGVLNLLYFGDNLCASGFFNDFVANRDFFLIRLQRCFRNFEFSVDTTTEGGDVYRFFPGPSPGIQLRVMTTDEVHIVLTPFDFPWAPMIEIFIGTNNNTQSVIRRNQEEIVAIVPTPGILFDQIWNGFRLTWANHIILVSREGDPFPFLAFTQRDFFNVNFYGLRTAASAAWTIQPVDADTGITPY